MRERMGVYFANTGMAYRAFIALIRASPALELLAASVRPAHLRVAMAPPLSATERDEARRLSGMKTPVVDIWKALTASRAKRRQPPPILTTVRRFLKAKTYRQGAPEARGRKRKLSRRIVLKMDKVRKALITRADSEYEVHWDDVRKKARVPKTHSSKLLRTTALAIPSAVIRKGVADLKARARNCYENDGRVVTWE